MRFPWFRRKPDPLEEKARGIVEHADRKVTEALPGLVSRFGALRAADPLAWRRHATVAAARLAVYPLLRALDGDSLRFGKFLTRIRRDLVARFPGDDALWIESDKATIPPTGHERTRTLREVDESQALALARWTVAATVGGEAAGGYTETVQGVAVALRQAIDGYWRQ